MTMNDYERTVESLALVLDNFGYMHARRPNGETACGIRAALFAKAKDLSVYPWCAACQEHYNDRSLVISR
jgi:hypothetical protein